jgi:hypothetical protein
VITFNWDLLFERHLRQHEVDFDYCPQKDATNSLAFLKLHGSLDWYRGAELESTKGLEVLHRQLYRVGEPKAGKPHTGSLIDAVPFIVPPTFFKTFRGCADIEHIWTVAFQRLQSADQIYICGYRFPPEDFFGRFVFRRAIRANVLQRRRKSASPLKLVVINPNKEVADFVRRNIYRKARHENVRFEVSSLMK